MAYKQSTIYFVVYNAYPRFVHTTHRIIISLLYPWYVIIVPIYNAYPYFSLKNLGKVCIIYSKIQDSKVTLLQNGCTSQVLIHYFFVLLVLYQGHFLLLSLDFSIFFSHLKKISLCLPQIHSKLYICFTIKFFLSPTPQRSISL